MCKTWMEFPDSATELNQEMAIMDELHRDVEQKSLSRLKHEGKDKDERLFNPDDPYYQAE